MKSEAMQSTEVRDNKGEGGGGGEPQVRAEDNAEDKRTEELIYAENDDYLMLSVEPSGSKRKKLFEPPSVVVRQIA